MKAGQNQSRATRSIGQKKSRLRRCQSSPSHLSSNRSPRNGKSSIDGRKACVKHERVLQMAAVEITISGVLYDKVARTTQPVVLIGEASLTGLSIGGGPMPGGPGPGQPPGIWGPTDPRPTPPIPIYPGGSPNPPGIWGPTDPRPTPPIYLPKPPEGYPQPPTEGVKPPPPEGGWGYHPDYGWGYFPAGGGKPQPIP